MSSKRFNPFKDFQFDQIQIREGLVKYSRLHGLNLTTGAGTTRIRFLNNQFINRILGVRLICLDCERSIKLALEFKDN